MKTGGITTKMGRVVFEAINRLMIDQYPGTSIGIIVAAVCGSLVGRFVGWIPFIGNILSNVLELLGLGFGISIGGKLDGGSTGNGQTVEQSCVILINSAVIR